MIVPTKWPLIVDLDGTLTPTDTLAEALAMLVKQSPVYIGVLPFWLAKGRANLKNEVAKRTAVSAELLPYNQALLAYIQNERATGRRIVLATASHHSMAQRVADHLGIFDEVLATQGDENLKGSSKLREIKKQIGEEFAYAGDSAADIPIWREAKSAVLVGTSKKTSSEVLRTTPIERDFPREGGGLALWGRALRLHQWVKNLLLFVPLLTAFSFLDFGKLALTLAAVLSFSLAASATYIVNDLWDIENDRAHPRKRMRPFASARIKIHHGLAAAGGLLALGLIIGLMISKSFFFVLLVYLCLTSSYSWVLKKYVLVDVLMLSILYTLRILAGAVAMGIVISSWLLAFSAFMFLSLALVKRCAELVSLADASIGATNGRDYRVTDLVVLWPLGIGAALSATVVFGLFISAPETQAKYASPALLWLVAIGLIYWLGRLWIKTSRGEMHDDPVVYAIKDRGSRLTVLCMITLVLIAHFASLVKLA